MGGWCGVEMRVQTRRGRSGAAQCLPYPSNDSAVEEHGELFYHMLCGEDPVRILPFTFAGLRMYSLCCNALSPCSLRPTGPSVQNCMHRRSLFVALQRFAVGTPFSCIKEDAAHLSAPQAMRSKQVCVL